MQGIHNYYLDFLKSYKKFINDIFPQINHFQFNYSDSTYLNYNLYKDHVQEFPICHINLNNIQTEDNAHVIRKLATSASGISNLNILQHIANNHTTKESVLLDFKFVVLDMQIRINFDNSGDIFNYMNMIQTQYTKNMMFYEYKYNAYINITKLANNWQSTDKLENVVYRTVDDTIQKYAIYNIEPIFKINNISSSKTVQTVSQDDNFLEIDMEVRLKVPNRMGTNSFNDQLLKGIELIINTASQSESLPILIDMDNDVYSSNRNKIDKLYLLDKNNFNFKNIVQTIDGVSKDTMFYELGINKTLEETLKNKRLAIYMVNDSISSEPQTIFIELGVFENLVVTNKLIRTDTKLLIDIGIDKLAKSELSTFAFGDLNRLELLVFN